MAFKKCPKEHAQISFKHQKSNKENKPGKKFCQIAKSQKNVSDVSERL